MAQKIKTTFYFTLIFVGLTCAGCSHSATKTAASERISSTTSRPTTQTTVLTPSSVTTTKATAPLCSASSIQPASPQAAVAAGTVVTTFVFTNVGPNVCNFAGYPTIVFLNSQGNKVAAEISTGSVPGYPTSQQAISVSQNHSFGFGISYSDVGVQTNCNKVNKISIILPQFSTPITEDYSAVICNPPAVVVSPVIIK